MGEEREWLCPLALAGRCHTARDSRAGQGWSLLEKAGSPLEHREPPEAAGFSSTENEVSQVMSQQDTGVGQGKASAGCPEAFKC